MLRSMNWLFLVACVPFLALIGGCQTSPDTASDRTDLEQSASQIINQAYKEDPSLRNFVNHSQGYAVFPDAGKGGLIVGGGYGKGVVYEQGKLAGYCDLTQVTVGAQIGGQTFSEIIVFETPAVMEKFKSGRFNFNAQATAVAIESGAAANAKYAEGVAVFILGEEGLMAEASLGGQQFRFQPIVADKHSADAEESNHK